MSTTKLTAGELLGTWGKAIMGLVIAFLTSYSAALPEGVNTGEWLGIATVSVGATGAIWLVPKAPAWLREYGKPVAGGVAITLGQLATAWTATAGLSQRDVLEALLAGVVAIGGVAVVSNAAASDPVVRTADGKYAIVPVTAEQKALLVAEPPPVVSPDVHNLEGDDPAPLPADPNFEEDGGPGEDEDTPQANIVYPVENPDARKDI